MSKKKKTTKVEVIDKDSSTVRKKNKSKQITGTVESPVEPTSNNQADINWEKLEAYLQCGASAVSAAAMLGVHEKTLRRRVGQRYGMSFSEYKDKVGAGVQIMLVSKALKMAQAGNTAVMIFMLKNKCGYSDKNESKVDTTVTFNLNYKLDE